MKKLAFVLALSTMSSPLALAHGQTVTPTSPQAPPFRVVLEVVNDPNATGTSTYVVALTQQIQDRWLGLLGPDAQQHLPNAPEGEISVTINPDGHPSAVKVMHATHEANFDKACYRAITEGSFPPLPTDLPKADLKLRVHFRVLLYPTHPAPR